ncbi:MAG: MG2 domain-containing protein [Planctomycetaceae bacterium]
MSRTIRFAAFALLITTCSTMWYLWAADTDTPLSSVRQAAQKENSAGNYRDAYDLYRKLVLDERNEGKDLEDDLAAAWSCLRQLQRDHEQDELLATAIETHPTDPHVYYRAAYLLNMANHNGFRVAGEFQRGQQRGGGEFVQSVERDRVQALQWMVKANELNQGQFTGQDLANFWSIYKNILIANRYGGNAWRLQTLTDLTTLPDYEEGYGYGWRHQSSLGAPVDEEGNPVLYGIPESLDSAKSDGERWRYAMEQIVAAVPARRLTEDSELANFLFQQFGVHTLGASGIVLPSDEKEDGQATDNPASLITIRSLGDDETIARLATGVKRFKLPDEFNYIKILQRIANSEGKPGFNDGAHAQLAQIYTNRQQYDKAAEWWRKSIQQFGKSDSSRQQNLDQIIKNWGQFEPVMTQPSGKGATVEYRFRNGSHVEFEAHALKIETLLIDVKNYLKSRPKELQWQEMQIDNLGYRIVHENQQKYLGEQVAKWSLDVSPREGHLDRRVTVTTPLQKAGAYLVTAKMQNGNTSRIILWLDDLVIAKKALNGQTMYFVADAVSGKPVAGANVEFFGWRQERVPNTKRDIRMIIENFSEFSDKDGMVFTKQDQQQRNLQWLTIARTNKGQLAYLGFSGVWYRDYSSQSLKQQKVFIATDRPAYRPGQTLFFKCWAGEADYSADGANPWAGKDFTVTINDPEGTAVKTFNLKSDEYGGFNGELELGDDVKLGRYNVSTNHANQIFGNGSFLVEEYKKPEFEVTVEMPDKPAELGEIIQVKVKASYYFGGPVQNARVHLKVERNSRESRWFAPMPWDWLYGEGYWWFASDYGWYPGFHRWGCFEPRPHWIHWNPQPPELVLEQDLDIGKDGTVSFDIDTSLAKALHGDQDHEYTVTAEVTDASRRTIVGSGKVLATREPFKVNLWVNQGHYRVGDTINAHIAALTANGTGVTGNGKLTLYKIRYDNEGLPQEEVVQEWNLATNDKGRAEQQLKATAGGQYRLAYELTTGEGDARRTVEGGYLFVVRGDGFDGAEFRFNDLELVMDKREYAPGEEIELLINTNRIGSTVLLFLRPENGVCKSPPHVLQIAGKSTVVKVLVDRSDMPNFFIEAVTVSNGKLHSAMKEVVVPPEKRVLNVEILPSKESYKPGEKADVRVKLTDFNGEPFTGSLAMAVYDRSIDYISNGSLTPNIRDFFWKWRRSHHPSTEHSLQRYFGILMKDGELAMSPLGAFGQMVADSDYAENAKYVGRNALQMRGRTELSEGMAFESPAADAAPMASMVMSKAAGGFGGADKDGAELVAPTVRKEFADTAYWNGTLTTNRRGIAKVSFDMPENLTGWKIKTWGMGSGTQVGEGSSEVVTAKDLLVRLQAPRFFVEKDEVVLSAIVQNRLATGKTAHVRLELAGGTLELMDGVALEQVVTIPSDGEIRVDWRCKAVAEGEAVVTMSALTDEESDAMQMTFPVLVHGHLKTQSFSGVVQRGENSSEVSILVPDDRRPEQSRLELRFSPSLAGAMVDALPYLASYPYGCTEQTLNRFLPTVITQQLLLSMKLDLETIRDKRTNLNAQQLGDPATRAAQWKHWEHNPVFDEAEVQAMVKKGVNDLTAMQNSDGGWGWFSGYNEHSYPHTTAVVVHGLQLAEQNKVALVPDVLPKGLAWLEAYQAKQVELLKEAEFRATLKGEALRKRNRPYKTRVDDTDALVFMILCESDKLNESMKAYLFRDRLSLSLYSQALVGLAMHEIGDADKRDQIIRNIDQFLTVDDANQTAFLDLPGGNWYWYGSNIEANAFYLKLLTRVNPEDPKVAGLVKYLINNRRHGTYWHNTRDTAYCIEALAEYFVASGESQPNLLVEVYFDGELKKSVEITPEVLFTFDNTFVLSGNELASGRHKVELRTRSLDGSKTSPVYFNLYQTDFSTEDFLTSAGLEIAVQRKFYKLVQRKDATDTVRGQRGQAIDQQVLKYDRVELPNLSAIESGDLIEVELEIDSKNDYEYLVFEDFKAAGCEPVDVRSGYIAEAHGAYVEFRDEKVAFFFRTLARGKHSVSYRLRAEVPGEFSALPTQGAAMYAPELRANSDEMRVKIGENQKLNVPAN